MTEKKLLNDGGKTLSRQLEDAIRAKIISREWNTHSCIPSEKSLCDEYSLSRSTVRAALYRLEQDGLIYRRQGKGTFVSPSHEGVSFKDTGLNVRGKLDSLMPTPVARVVRFGLIPAPDHVAQLMEVTPGEDIYEIVRARYRMIPGSTPCMIQYSYMSPRIGRRIDTDGLILQRLSVQIAEKCGITPSRLTQWLEAALASAFEAHELRISSGSPVMFADELAFDTNDRPYLFTRFVVIAHLLRLCFE